MRCLVGPPRHASVPHRIFLRCAGESKPRSLLSLQLALLCCACVVFESHIVTAAGPNEGLKRQLLTAAPDAWRRWEEWTVHTESEFHEEELRRSSLGKPVSATDLHYYLNGGTRRRHFFRVLPDGRRYEEIAIQRGDKYRFYAERYNDDRLVVTDVRPGPPGEGERTVPPVTEAPYTVYYRHLTELVKNPRFVFDVSAVVGKDPSERVRVTFLYDTKGEKIPRIREGWVELCPREDWAVQEFLIKDPNGNYIGRKIRYGEGSGPQKPLVEVRTSYLGPGGNTEGDQTLVRFKKQVPSQEPDEFYSSSAVGLPEFNFAGEKSRGGYWLMLLTVGIILIVLAALARRRWQPQVDT